MIRAANVHLLVVVILLWLLVTVLLPLAVVPLAASEVLFINMTSI